MKYIEEYKEGDRISDVYLCKKRQAAVTKGGKAYENIILQDKTGVIDAKIWDPSGAGIDDFDVLDYIEVYGDINSFMGSLQASLKRVRRCREGEYIPSDYLPISEYDIDDMYSELLSVIASIDNVYLNQLLSKIYIDDEVIVRAFKGSSAAKTVHHGFVGGLLEHTLSVIRLSEYYARSYPIINRNLLLSAAMLHDLGKTRELSRFPENDYTDEGQLVGHIIIGTNIIMNKIELIEEFPLNLRNELIHCILAHHGEYEYGSPKKPALIEALALNLADNADSKLQIFKEALSSATGNDWLGRNRWLDSDIRKTRG